MSSRSGVVRYGTSNNAGSNRRDFRIESAPSGSNSILVRRARREEIGLVYNGFRVGYVQYRNDWRDDYFCYPHYVFDPFTSTRFYSSPWYYYPVLPAYINPTRVIIIGSPIWIFDNRCEPYPYRRFASWDRDDRYDRRRSDLDEAIDDLTDAYEEGSRRSVERLVPRDGRVGIFLDDRYSYSLSADDFYDLLMDGIQSARTRSFDIENVRIRGNVARVTATHRFSDPWGQVNEVLHSYTLVDEGRRVVIREFGTSRARGW